MSHPPEFQDDCFCQMFFIHFKKKKKKSKTQEINYCYEFCFLVLTMFPELCVHLPAGVQMHQRYYEEKWVTQIGTKIISKGRYGDNQMGIGYTNFQKNHNAFAHM